MRTRCLLLLALITLGSACGRRPPGSDWAVYGGSKAGGHYSPLSEVDTDNVNRLQVAWTYHCGDAQSKTQIQANPLIIDGVLYGISPRLKLFALRASDGESLWTFDPHKIVGSLSVCRGLAYYDGGAKDRRLFYAAGDRLFGIDAATGRILPGFGQGGSIDLHEGLGRPVADRYIAATSPGIVWKDLLIIGDRVSEEADAAPGDIRAYDVHNGRLRWIFHTIPWPGEAGYGTWTDTAAYRHIGGLNDWSGFTLDQDRGIVYAATGSASYDFFGGRRLGQDLYANCLLALDASNGRLLWHYQTVHHDLWDRDLPTPPVLVQVRKGGVRVDALAQPTKSGFLFILNRVTGEPLYPVKETPVPDSSSLTGDHPWPTQPIPTFPAPFARQSLTVQDLNPMLPDSERDSLAGRLTGWAHNDMFDPPSPRGTLIFPGFDGGAEWGGPAYDPRTGILYVNANQMAWVLTMVPVKPGQSRETNLEAGSRLYQTTCMACHGPDRRGAGNAPGLIGMGQRYTLDSFYSLVTHGRRMMPGFGTLSEGEKAALASLVLDNNRLGKRPFVAPPRPFDPYLDLPYTSTGYNKFLTSEGYPAIRPPWGTLSAIDLNTGKYLWMDTLGDYPELKAKGYHTGTENYGGAVVTAGGLIFIAATRDAKIRAFNKRTGALLWEASLPACGFATPSVYAVDGREYLVIACGGGKLDQASGDAYVAFALQE